MDVRSVGPGYVEGPRSPSRTFTKVAVPLGTPSAIAPANGSTLTFPNDKLVVRWTPVTRADHYRVQYASSPSFATGTLLWSDTDLIREASVIQVETFGQTVYWRVRAESGANTSVGAWSSIRSFRVVWPTTVTLTAPADGATVTAPTLTWAPVAGARGYEIQVDDDPTFDEPLFTDHAVKPCIGWEAEYLPSTFYWRVRAQSYHAATGGWSEVRSVSISPSGDPPPDIDPVALVAPVLGGPADGATNVDVAADPLTWTPVDVTVGYDLQIVEADDDWFEFGVGLPTARGVPVIPGVDNGTTYKWRVRANATGHLSEIGPWSAARTFTTPTVAPMTLTSPSTGVTRVQRDLLFTWIGHPSAPVARVEFSRTASFDELIWFGVSGTSMSALRDAMPLGTWYWRVTAGRGEVRARSETRLITLIDDSPPVGTIGYPYERTSFESFPLQGQAEDTFGTIDRTAVSADGLSWTEYASDEQPTWSTISPEHGGTTYGPRQIFMKWRDDSGNWSQPVRSFFCYVSAIDFVLCDVVPPTVTRPVVRLGAQSSLSYGLVPVRATWVGSDATAGIARYEVALRTDGGAWVTVANDIASSVWNGLVSPGHTYQFRVRAEDGANLTSEWATGSAIKLSAYSELSSAVKYSGKWTSNTSTAYWGGKARSSTVAGSKATFTFTGHSLAIVSRLGPGRGKAEIWIGSTKMATVDLGSAAYTSQRIIWSGTWTSSATRTVTIKVLGTSGRPRVEVDGFIVGS